MFSKARSVLRGLLAIYFILMISSCSYFFGDKETSSDEPIVVSLSDKASVSCLDENTEVLQDYFEMKRNDDKMAADMRRMKTCLSDAISLFVRYTEGREGNIYEPKEIHRFISAVVDGYNHPPSLIEEAIRLKASLIGGSPFTISKYELNLVVPILDFIYDKLAFHAQDRQFIFSRDKLTGDISKYRMDFKRSVDRLRASIREIRSLKLKTIGVFDFDSLGRLITLFIDSDETKEEWRDHLKLIDVLQSLVTTGRRGEIDAVNLQFSFERLTDLWTTYVKFQKFLHDDLFYRDMATVFTFPGLVTRLTEDPLVFEGGKSEIFREIQGEVIDTLNASLKYSSRRNIPLGYFDSLIDVLHEIKSFPSYLSPSTLKEMMPLLFGRWLVTGECKGDCEADKYTADSSKNLTKFINQWHERQQWINQIGKRQRGAVNLRSLRAKTRNLKSFKNIALNIKYGHWGQFLFVEEHDLTYKDLVILNSLYTIAEIFMSPYNLDKNDSVNFAMSQDETQDLYLWGRQLGVDLQLMDPRSRTSGSSAFIEANLFLGVSENPDSMEFIEFVEYLEISISTGIRTTYLNDNMFTSCRISGLIDVFGFERMRTNCFRQEFRDNFAEYFLGTIPRMKKFYEEKLTPYQREEFAISAEKSARQGFLIDDPFDTDSIRITGSVLQYTESLFARFDEDESGELDLVEFEKALAHVQPGLRILIEDELDAGTLKAVRRAFPEFERTLMTYAIVNGTLPPLLFVETELGQKFEAAGMILGTTPDYRQSWFGSWFNYLFGNDDEGRDPIEVAREKLEQRKKDRKPIKLIDGLLELRGFNDRWNSMMNKDFKVTRAEILAVISGLSDFARISKIKQLKVLFDKHQLAFEQKITNLDHEVLPDILAALNCSTRVGDKAKQWLIDNQDKYWVKDDYKPFGIVDFLIPIGEDDSNEFVSTFLLGWHGAVLAALLKTVKEDPKMSNLCSIPYIEELNPPVEKIEIIQRHCRMKDSDRRLFKDSQEGVVMINCREKPLGEQK